MEGEGFKLLEDPKYAGPIVGRIQRRPGVGSKEAREIASKYRWWDNDLRYDGRCKRWHVFRAKY